MTDAAPAKKPQSWPPGLWRWLLLGAVGFGLLPWYALEDSIFTFDWLPYYPYDSELSPAPWQAGLHGRGWLLVYLPFILLPLISRRAQVLIAAGVGGVLWSLIHGFSVGPLGVEGWLAFAFPDGARQYGMGIGAVAVHLSFIAYFVYGVAARGAFFGDRFRVGALAVSSIGVLTFVVVPVGALILRSVETYEGALSLGVLFDNLTSGRVWSLPGSGRIGVAWSTLLLALVVATLSTVLGAAFALLATRSRLPGRRSLRAFGIFPIITPPFVLGLALILIFGRSGTATVWVASLLGVEPSRWIFGFWGLVIAQLLAFTPVAFLVLAGVVDGVSPSLEEASMTLGASRWRTYLGVSLPLMRPGLANAFLLGFIESLADFGNPLVLGGAYEVLSTEIYFAVAGAQSDIPRAAALALVLLGFTLLAFFGQRRWVGNKGYATVSGKADSGAACPLPISLEWGLALVVLPWIVFTVAVYATVAVGGFVTLWGHDHSFTWAHYQNMFAVQDGLHFTGGAWDSLFSTVIVAVISAPLTAGLGLLIAWLLDRERFVGHTSFELATMLSFAVPGTVVGVSYVLAFNTPPLELTGTAAILVICFVFRNLPVGVRGGLAALSQIDKSLDEASATLGATGGTTVRRALLPLLSPALMAALVYGFVRAMTAVSAVIFLVSADWDLSTTYILGRVEQGEYGPAVAYSSALIVFMATVIAAMQILVAGRQDRRLGRRST